MGPLVVGGCFLQCCNVLEDFLTISVDDDDQMATYRFMVTSSISKKTFSMMNPLGADPSLLMHNF